MNRLFCSFCLALMLLTSCGPGSNRFRIEGRLRHMNQGEFYVYSPDGGILGIDTIKVHEGRFAYETPLRDAATFVVIFPNFSELAVFGEPGKTAEIKGDASHMKELTVSGTDDNEEMTKIRMDINRLLPPQIPNAVEGYIKMKEHRGSLSSIYLLKRYFVYDNNQADYRKAAILTKMLVEANPDNGQLIELDKQLKILAHVSMDKLPKFTATDVKGNKVSEGDLKAKVNVVSAWASWNNRSTDMQRRLKEKKKKFGDRLAIVSICIDGNPKVCKRTVVEKDSLKWPTVCDGKMWNTPLLAKFGFGDIPSNVVIDNKGNILERNLTPQKLDDVIEDIFKHE